MRAGCNGGGSGSWQGYALPDMWVAVGVRWTDFTGAIRVHQPQAPMTAMTLAATLRQIQASRGIADAHLVTRRMCGDRALDEWAAAPPAAETIG